MERFVLATPDNRYLTSGPIRFNSDPWSALHYKSYEKASQSLEYYKINAPPFFEEVTVKRLRICVESVNTVTKAEIFNAVYDHS